MAAPGRHKTSFEIDTEKVSAATASVSAIPAPTAAPPSSGRRDAARSGRRSTAGRHTASATSTPPCT
ncbi:MAG TPA: hypothetical protein VFC52_05070, partial [Solirubrobacterales bacterium]|nr:hypothetical protein [Solirubrobacterales bacterium]